uniref:Uncharacterized protein n=1 Tax=Trypanosoma congolense (strain IL3000) TaxID=1068625 RepID=G0V2D9_TRYCI|nr:hypothetical protein, unlikely [Trypanosoma congolense IL3000]
MCDTSSSFLEYKYSGILRDFLWWMLDLAGYIYICVRLCVCVFPSSTVSTNCLHIPLMYVCIYIYIRLPFVSFCEKHTQTHTSRTPITVDFCCHASPTHLQSQKQWIKKTKECKGRSGTIEMELGKLFFLNKKKKRRGNRIFV